MGWKYRKLISSDSHVNEPEDLYWNSLGTTFGERTPPPSHFSVLYAESDLAWIYR